MAEVHWPTLCRGYKVQEPGKHDTAVLADLMLDSYIGTIDYDGETLQDAVKEVEGYFAGKTGQLLSDCSWLCLTGEELVSACLVAHWSKRPGPLISYLMTRPRWKNKGMAATVIERALQSTTDQGHMKVHAFVTEGNLPSVAIFTHFGFTKVTRIL
jgi:GNAT superfamily N-acetyltransferase